MKVICSWCKKDMGKVPSTCRAENIITHGICEDCAKELFAQLGMKLEAFIDSLGVPIILLDETCTVKTTNKQAQGFLKKDLSEIENYRGGEVFECAYSKLPEKCGNTIHCNGCTIRNTVMDTFHSGKSHLEKPAYLKRGIPDAYQRIDFLISTEKVGNVVLLRIDKANI